MTGFQKAELRITWENISTTQMRELCGTYFQKVIEWVQSVFTNYRKEMKGVPFGILYNKFKKKTFDAKKIEKEITKLMEDEDVN